MMLVPFKDFPYSSEMIMLFRSGSSAHGAALPDSDVDWSGVFIEPPEKIIGLDRYEHYVSNTGIEDFPDVCLYSLRKWAGLAAAGNPSSLYFLFAPRTDERWPWAYVQKESQTFLSKGHVRPFLGFANAQLKRLFGEKGQKNCHRADLEEKYGYDTKYAMHVIRLYGEAKELMETGKITLPRPNKGQLIAIRKGAYQLHEIREMAVELEAEALRSSDRSPLPEKIDRGKISNLIARIYLQWWEYRKENYVTYL